VVAMLVGIALDERAIASIDDLAQKYVPALKGHPYGETSIRHLLTMSSGVRFSERYDGNDDMALFARKTVFEGPAGVEAVLPFTQREHKAGTQFHYSSAETYVLGLVLRAATGQTLAEYLSQKIWRPMGAEADASWSLDKAGNELAFVGLNATLRDWGRFGLLLAEGGVRNGLEIIPTAWVRDATRPSPASRGYGYQTWLLGARDGNGFALMGLRGQAIYVHPPTKTVVVHTAVHWGPGDPSSSDQSALYSAYVSKLN